ncbi:hypothetical protein LU196_03050 [Pantoea sp. Mb-10]|uniref:hypothetical protein n=1 Tax=unclassified Pantoea TaxID=2630326 RepID=UPI001E40FB78|nr:MULTISPECIES: hypothetical protein [unclassified Pantoea]MCE0489036.1 hypothetical protein [Pantoea sp. Mb-10]MCE0503608.1 hypothetical protein [Pantoea sp. Pb-8]
MYTAPDEKNSVRQPTKKRRFEPVSDAPIPAVAPYLHALLHQPESRLSWALNAPEAATTAVEMGGQDNAGQGRGVTQEKQGKPVNQQRWISQVMQVTSDPSVTPLRHAAQESPIVRALQARPLSHDAVTPVHNNVIAHSPVAAPLPRIADLMPAQGTSGAHSTLPSDKQEPHASTAIPQSATATGLAGPVPSLTLDSTTLTDGPSRQLARMSAPALFAPLAESTPPPGLRRLTYTFRRTDPTGAMQVELLIPRQMPQPVTARVSSREVLDRLDVAIQQADAPPLALFEKQGQQRRAASYVLDEEEEA